MMTKRKWTHGPWVAMANGWIEAGDGDPVAMINEHGLPNDIFEEDMPNAHLIAAAPDLYEALDGMVRMSEINGTGDRVIHELSMPALAKARGET